ncbi:conserved hypothetical protein [Ricinus communis]|uniref:Uncharacterized protein n=1 Tax=Ricinus communis TaxID=3988 RepID=B9SXU3_RICCO|nr:conserved hypothetical protein [Ricinus communis]
MELDDHDTSLDTSTVQITHAPPKADLMVAKHTLRQLLSLDILTLTLALRSAFTVALALLQSAYAGIHYWVVEDHKAEHDVLTHEISTIDSQIVALIVGAKSLDMAYEQWPGG